LISVLAIVAGLVAISAAQATSSGAQVTQDIDNPGPVTVTVTGANFILNVSGAPTEVGPFNGTLTGTVDIDGILSFAQGDISFTDFDTIILVPAHVQPVADGDWTGTMDPNNGTVSISGPLTTLATVDSVGLVDCPIGPFNVQMQGTNYNDSNGNATISDPAYLVNELQPGTPGCNDQEAVVNGALPLPGEGAVTMPVSFEPVITGGGTPPPTTTTFTLPPTTAPATTATTAPTGETTVAAAATGGETLPRTGGRATVPVTVLGLALLGAGIALLVPTRRAAVRR
jgi:LPXTG-motif cell wall-anchored protein